MQLIFSSSDLDEKYKKRDRYSGMLQDFKEKEGYKPGFKLEYIDEAGRNLNQKEAFRQLSHRFHGKGSGKKKTEKRSKKQEEDNVSEPLCEIQKTSNLGFRPGPKQINLYSHRNRVET